MLLSQLIERLPGARLFGADVDIDRVVEDSRQAGPGAAFCAVRGMSVDGHDFIEKAAPLASAIICERQLELDVPHLVVSDSTRALGVISAALAGDPAASLQMVGITGTNGKTTCSYLIEAVLAAGGGTPGVIGTVNYRYRGTVKDAPYTTPVPGILHGQLAEFRAAGCDQAVMEVSSAALDHGRLEGVRFEVGVFTNLSQDHLDLHSSMAAYRDAKARLFSDYLEDDGTAVIVVDDAAAPAMISAAGEHRVLRVSTRADADAEVRVLSYESSVTGIVATIETPRGPLEVSSKALVGEYNVANIATAVAVGEALGLAHEAIARGLATMPGVPGRVERVANEHGLDIVVDYAHTPDALANVLRALRPITERRLICVFGCGGDRDPSKRPKMGAEVARGADLAVVTSDNPRTEEPQSIIDMIVPAVPEAAFVDVDRRTAIRAAIAEACPGDVVLIAGKGHEDYQILGTEKIHFDDREEAAAAVALRPTWTAEQVAREVGGRIRSGDPATLFFRPIIDGRAAAPGDLYVAIRGERFDGHDFVSQAAEAGATGLLVARSWTGTAPSGVCVIEADDPRTALGRLAHHHRMRWGKKIVGITGSSGKTTVKDMCAAALRALGRVHKPIGSLNNETGVPLTLLALRSYHDVAVIEMGMRGLGHIDYLAEIVRPDVAVVVNAQVAHVGVVGSVEQIAVAKSEIYAHLPAGGTAIAPVDDARLVSAARAGGTLVTFGVSEDADVRVVSYEPAAGGVSAIVLEAAGQRAAGEIPFVGAHNASNAACAIAAARALGASFEQATARLAGAEPSVMRGQVEIIAGRSVLIDCYNANPASMEAALKTLDELAGTRGKFAVLGDMLELGDGADEEHQRVATQAADLGVTVIALGEHAAHLAGASDAEVVADPQAAAARAMARTKPGDWLLIKASRGLRLERVADHLRQLGEAS